MREKLASQWPNPRFAHLRLYDFLAAFKLREMRAALVDNATTA